MTDRRELQELAARVGAEIQYDADGYIGRVIWDGVVYGDGTMRGLLGFAEKARENCGAPYYGLRPWEDPELVSVMVAL